MFLLFLFALIHCGLGLELRDNPAINMNNDLGLTLLQTMTTEDNVLVSPPALASSLLALTSGAIGDTRRQLREALNLEEKEIKTTIEGMRELLDSLSTNEMHLLSRVLVSSEPLKNKFKTMVKEFLRTEVLTVDFEDKHVTKNLNQWVNEKTDGKVVRLFKDRLDPQNSMVVTSVGHYLARLRGFRREQEKRPFRNHVSYSLPPISRDIYFQTSALPVNVWKSSELKSQLIEVPTTDQSMAFILVFPNNQSDLQFLNENMTSSALNSALQGVATANTTTRLVLPVFRLEAEYDLRELDLGDLKAVFSPEAEMTSLPTGSHVTTSVHKVLLEMTSEEGEGEGKGLEGAESGETLLVDRPFLLFVVERGSGGVAMGGRVQTLIDEELISFSFI